jgi:hypothetical protein
MTIEECENGTYYEEEADQHAEYWGFDIDTFRQVCGPATLED